MAQNKKIIKNFSYDDTNFEQENLPKKKKSLFVIFLGITAIFILIGIPYAIYKFQNPESNSILFKEPPILDSKTENLGATITIMIHAQDDYEYVEITLNLYGNDEQKPIKSETLRKENLKRGHTYTTSYTLKSLDEVFKLKKYNYELKSYA